MWHETTVLFPGFQSETPVDGPLYKRRLEWIVPPLAWLSDIEVRQIVKPSAVFEGQRLATNAGWWGVYHHATSKRSFPLVLDSDSDFAGSYNTQTIKHDYLWDHQALSGRAFEVVLEKAVDTSLPHHPIARLLLPLQSYPRDGRGECSLQHLMIRDDEGGWIVPQQTDDNSVATKYLEMISQLIPK